MPAAGGSPNACGCACSRPQLGWSGSGEDNCCGSTVPGPGARCWSEPLLGCGFCPSLDALLLLAVMCMRMYIRVPVHAGDPAEGVGTPAFPHRDFRCLASAEAPRQRPAEPS